MLPSENYREGCVFFQEFTACYTERMFRFTKPKNDIDIDIRFLLANERTLLAWIRTGLTLIAGGVAVGFIATGSTYGTVAGVGAIASGAAFAVIGYIRYQVADRAIRNGVLPPTGMAGLLVVATVIVFSVALIAARELQLFS